MNTRRIVLLASLCLAAGCARTHADDTRDAGVQSARITNEAGAAILTHDAAHPDLVAAGAPPDAGGEALESSDPAAPYRDDAGALRPGRASGALFPIGPGPVDTKGGTLEVRELVPASSYELWLGSERLVHTDASDAKLARQDAPIPSIEATFGAVPPYAEVLLVRWDGTGTDCDGLALTFVGIDAKKQAHLSNDVSFCGGPAPTVTKLIDKAGKTEALAIDVPEHRAAHGSGIVAPEHLTYRAGHVRRK